MLVGGKMEIYQKLVEKMYEKEEKGFNKIQSVVGTTLWWQANASKGYFTLLESEKDGEILNGVLYNNHEGISEERVNSLKWGWFKEYVVGWLRYVIYPNPPIRKEWEKYRIETGYRWLNEFEGFSNLFWSYKGEWLNPDKIILSFVDLEGNIIESHSVSIEDALQKALYYSEREAYNLCKENPKAGRFFVYQYREMFERTDLLDQFLNEVGEVIKVRNHVAVIKRKRITPTAIRWTILLKTGGSEWNKRSFTVGDAMKSQKWPHKFGDVERWLSENCCSAEHYRSILRWLANVMI